MSSEERKQILKMIEAEKISPAEGVNLLAALDENPVMDGVDDDFTEASQNAGFDSREGLDAVASKVRSYWHIPLWIGVGITSLSGMLMSWAMQVSGFGFWFYCAWLPFLLGVLIIGLVAGGRSSRWLFVHIKQSPDSTDRNISFGFPLPFGLGAWALRSFGHFIPGLDDFSVDALLKVLEENPVGEPKLVVDVHDDEDGEHVQVFVA